MQKKVQKRTREDAAQEDEKTEHEMAGLMDHSEIEASQRKSPKRRATGGNEHGNDDASSSEEEHMQRLDKHMQKVQTSIYIYILKHIKGKR